MRNMVGLRILIAALVIIGITQAAQAAEITIDGKIDDWKASEPLNVKINQTSNDPSLIIKNVFSKINNQNMYITYQMSARPNTYASYIAFIDSDVDGIYDFAISFLPDKNRNPRYIHDIILCDVLKNEMTTNCNDFAYGNSKLNDVIELEVPLDRLPKKINNNYNILIKIYDNTNQKWAAITTSSSAPAKTYPYSQPAPAQQQDSLNWGLVGGILAVIAIGIVVLSLRRRESARTPEQSSRTGSDTLEAGYDIEHETPFPQYLPKADKLLVLRESEFFNGFIRIKLSVKNKMQYTVTDVFLDLDVDENILRFDHHEPETYDVKKEKVQLGNIPPDNDRTIALYLDPLICAKEGTDINARVDYKDAYGKPDSVRIRPLRIKVVCPIFQTEQDINIGRLKELVESLPAYGSKVFSLRKGIEIGEAAALCREVIQMHDVRHVRTFRTTDSKTYEIWYYGKTKVERIDLVIKANVSKETESIEVFVAAPDQKALTGLLAELGRNLTKRGESLGKLAPQVNLTIKGSIIQRSRLLDFCDFNGICGANVVIEDSLVQRSNIGVSRE